MLLKKIKKPFVICWGCSSADLNKGAFGTLDDGMCGRLGCSLNGSARHKQQNSQNCKNNTSRDVSHIKATRSHAPDVVEFNGEKQEGGWIFFYEEALPSRCQAFNAAPFRSSDTFLQNQRANTGADLLGRGIFLWMTTVFHNICLLQCIIKAITCTPPLTSSHMLTQAISQGVNLAAKSQRRNTHSETSC